MEFKHFKYIDGSDYSHGSNYIRKGGIELTDIFGIEPPDETGKFRIVDCCDGAFDTKLTKLELLELLNEAIDYVNSTVS